MRISFTFAALLMSMLAVSAQNGWVRTGVKACRSGDYVVAIEELTKALEHKGMLSDRQLPDAYYYRAQARLLLLCQLGSNQPHNRQAAQAGSHLKAFDDLREAAFTDRGKHKGRIREARRLLFDLLLEEALRKVDFGRQEGLSLTERDVAYREARRFLQTAARIDPDHYLLLDLTAQVCLGLEDYEKALELFHQAIQAFREDPPERPDLLFAYAFYRKTLAHYHYRYRRDSSAREPSKYDIDLALASVEQGIEFLKTEFKRVKNNRQLSPRDKAVYEAQYKDIQIDLRHLQLDLYLNAPDRYNEALQLFSQITKDDAGEYLYHIAYGQLLELSDPQRAAGVYEKALSLSPDRTEAPFNLGAMYLNQASKIIKQARRQERIKLYAQQMKEAREILQKARPFFEQVHRIDPDNLEVLNALMQICVVLEDTDGYQSYRSSKVELLSR